jgi:hypothetical protein
MEIHTLSTVISFITLIAIIILLNHFDSNDETFLESYGLNNMSVVDIVNNLEQRSDEPEGFYASISGSSLTLGDDSNEVTLSLPHELFYLSFAPYINQPHPCFNHNLVTCTGELQNQSFFITVTNRNSQVTIYSGWIETSNRGFAGIWLPQNEELLLTVSDGTLYGESFVNTFESSPSCLTSLRLIE